jgi:hypothetical protein
MRATPPVPTSLVRDLTLWALDQYAPAVRKSLVRSTVKYMPRKRIVRATFDYDPRRFLDAVKDTRRRKMKRR